MNTTLRLIKGCLAMFLFITLPAWSGPSHTSSSKDQATPKAEQLTSAQREVIAGLTLDQRAGIGMASSEWYCPEDAVLSTTGYATIDSTKFDGNSVKTGCFEFGNNQKMHSQAITKNASFATICPVKLVDHDDSQHATDCRGSNADVIEKNSMMKIDSSGDDFLLTVYGHHADNSFYSTSVPLKPAPNGSNKTAYLSGNDSEHAYYVYVLHAVTGTTPPDLIKHYVVEVFYKKDGAFLCADEIPSAPMAMDCDTIKNEGEGDTGGGHEPPPKQN
jgi:hypothetical protein